MILLINTYGVSVFRGNSDIIFYIIEIRSEKRHCFAVFNSIDGVLDLLSKEREGIDLRYDPKFGFSRNLYELYKNTKYGFFSKLENRQVYIGGC